jgi:hypothetical protein
MMRMAGEAPRLYQPIKDALNNALGSVAAFAHAGESVRGL